MNQEELAPFLKPERRQWNRIMAEFAGENIIRVDRLRGGSRISPVVTTALWVRKAPNTNRPTEVIKRRCNPKAKSLNWAFGSKNYQAPRKKVCDIPQLRLI